MKIKLISNSHLHLQSSAQDTLIINALFGWVEKE